ncbi:MAG TPA: GNAT family protein [Chthoniobacterales bacterium]|nr:GNAT family protein [Chthoniobacterales bacterium]
MTPESNVPTGVWPYPTEFPELLLRPLQEQDAEELFELTDRNRGHLLRWLPWVDATRTPNDSSLFVRHTIAEQASLRAVHCAITLRKEIIGVIAFNAIDHFHRSSTVGYWLAQTHTGNGYMTGAVRALIQLGFEYLNLNRIEIRIAPENRASRAVCVRLQFRHEGILREAEWLGDKFVDLEVYSLLKSDWLLTASDNERQRTSARLG